MDPIVERARQGDRAALEDVLDRLAPMIQRYSTHMCGNPAEADDVLQDTLLSVATNLHAFEGRSALSSWVISIARSACSRRRRGLKNRPGIELAALAEPIDPALGPEQKAESAELARALGAAIDRLPDEQREALLLRDVEGMSAAEAAESIGIGVPALKSRLHRARAALRAELAPLLEPARAGEARAGAEDARAAGQTCPDVVALWSQKLEGELTRDDCATMEAHLSGCPDCERACNALKAALLACKHSRSQALSPEVHERVRRALAAAGG